MNQAAARVAASPMMFATKETANLVRALLRAQDTPDDMAEALRGALFGMIEAWCSSHEDRAEAESHLHEEIEVFLSALRKEAPARVQ